MIATTYYTHLTSPIGTLFVQGDGQFITGLYLPQHKGFAGPDPTWQPSAASFVALRNQLSEYFAGHRQHFDIPLKLAGTRFQNRVWQELARIPFGATITYAELARRIGQPTASRAVGHANAKNPLSILIPCHRVIATSGQLRGYAGGLPQKHWLLDHECRIKKHSAPSRSAASRVPAPVA
jgi:methylated-DNA-[protein]-cysteine S-methyltransferase